MYADALFNKSDSAKFSYYDYTYYGNALSGAGQHDKAVDMYKKALEQEDMDNKAKRAGVIKQLSDAYKAQEDFPNAIKNYEEYLNTVEKASANDIAALAQLHVQHASKKTTPEEQAQCFIMADKTYQDLENKFEDASEYATFMRARVNSYMDPDQKKGLAKPFYEKLDQLIGAKENKDATDKARLTESYRYLISYFFVIQDNKETAKQYAQKLLEIDPENEIAKQVMTTK
jgi:tetratricopeptide (TPR) repeat protein